uniref:Uncharacterized protein n=1 Tax=Candidatus Kentrum sp. MB TaxID=2138164 RepID=A0A451BCH5_9GAMM|nr:MAG: hypothetical protein BECKMB1821I_GA0114274_10373 [Candidatus Kentron sp. MB]VFK75945.1 MAG: hypothetical protein BECKMB1821H_GA0114242_103624 [Candidatus Kentron sp. MB]
MTKEAACKIITFDWAIKTVPGEGLSEAFGLWDRQDHRGERKSWRHL